MKRALFWLRLWKLALWERLVGIWCRGCGAHAFLPARGWRWGTIYDGTAAWLCRDCVNDDRENEPR